MPGVRATASIMFANYYTARAGILQNKPKVLLQLLFYTATFWRNPSTSARRSSAAFSAASDAASAVSAEERVSVAAPATSPSTLTISFAPLAAPLTLRVISPVAALCS